MSRRAWATDSSLRWFASRGLTPELVAVEGTFSGRPSDGGAESFGPDDTRERRILLITVSGPNQLLVNRPTRYEAVIVDQETNQPVTDVQTRWTILPANAKAVAEPGDRLFTYVTADVPGDLTLTVAVDGDTNVVSPLHVTVLATVIAKPAPRHQIPLYGQGWASLVLAVVLILAIIVLALEDVVSGEAVAPILGAIAGYIFGVGVQARKESDS